jgi:hypothetical protein
MKLLPVVLPQLEGAWLALFRGLFAAAFALAVFSSAAATWYETHHGGNTTTIANALGLGLRIFPPLNELGWRINRPLSREAITADIRTGDEIVALNGHAVTNRTTYASLAQWLDAREGKVTRLGFSRAGGASFERTLVWHGRNVDDWYKGSGLTPELELLARRIAFDLTTLALLVPAGLLFLRRPREIVAATFALCLVLLTIGPTYEFWAGIGWADFHKSVAALPYILAPMVGCAFPDGRYFPAWTRFSLVLVPLILLPLVPVATHYGNFALLSSPVFIAVTLPLWLRYRTLHSGPERQQFRIVILSIATGGLVSSARLALTWVQASLSPSPLSPWIDLSSFFIFALGYAIIGAGFAVALLRYRLYDAEALISRSAALTVTMLLLAGVWAALERTAEAVFAGALGSGQATLAAIVSAALAVVLVTPLHGRLQAILEKRVHGRVWHLKARLPAQIATLAQHASRQALGAALIRHVASALHVDRAAIVMAEDDCLTVAAGQGISADQVCVWLIGGTLPPSGASVDDDPAFPFRFALADEEVPTKSWLLLGPRPDGTSINRDERESLAELAPSMARGLDIAQTRDAHNRRIASTLAALEARLAALEMRVEGALVAGST